MNSLKTKNLLMVNEKKYLSIFSLLNEALSLLPSRSVESLNRLIKLGKKIVKKTPHLVHAYIVLVIAYYRKREYDKAYKFGQKALEFYWDPAIIPILEYLYLHYENQFHFIRTVRKIHEEEAREIFAGEIFVRVEHHHQENILDFIEITIKLLLFEIHFVYPQIVFFSQNDFQELLESCGLDTTFYVVSKQINECPIEEIHDHVQHIWTNSNETFVVFTEHDPFSYFKEDAFAGFIAIEGDFRAIRQFNTLLYDHMKESRPIKDELRCELLIPFRNDWIPGRFFKK